jgi:NAD+ diphosphatase
MLPDSSSLIVLRDFGHTFVPGIDPPPARSKSAVWLIYQGEKLLGLEAQDGLLPLIGSSPEDWGLPPLDTAYLGSLAVAGAAGDANEGEVLHCFAGGVPEGAALPSGVAALDLRTLFGVWPEGWIGLAGRAKLIAQWVRDHQYCGRCGAPTDATRGERARRCPQCGLSNYPRISPAIIIAITRHTPAGEQILLARNHRFPPGRYSVVAGFVEAGETLEECAAREVQEEVGVQITNIRYFGSQSWPFPNSLMIGLTAEYAGGEICLEESEIADAQWFSPHNLPQLPPRISIARRLIEAYLQRQTAGVS